MKSPAFRTHNNGTLATTDTMPKIIAACADRITLIVVWIDAAIKATAGHIINPVTAMAGRITMGTAATHVAGTTIGARADMR